MTAICPACGPADASAFARRGGAEAAPAPAVIRLALPDIHCAACIASAEAALAAEPGVAAARVNLSRKLAEVKAAEWVEPDRLIAALKKAGHAALELDEAALGPERDAAETRELLLSLGVAGFAMMNVMLLSVAVWSGAEAATRELLHWVSALIALPAVAFAARPFFRSAWAGLRAGRLGMDMPISVAILLSSGVSLYEVAEGGRHAWFDAALALTFFLLLGRLLEARARAAARSAARSLAALESPRALRIGADGAAESVRVAELRVGDLVRIPPGMRAPVDGVVETGATDLDRSALTGETVPVPVGPGAEVAAGETNLTGPITLRAVAVGEDTTLRRMAELVSAAEQGRGAFRSLADRAGRAYAPLVHLLALGAFAVWAHVSGDWRFALNVATATLIITCPCALGLAAPAVATAAAGKLFRRGALLKGGDALERLAEADVAVFDKTGTLTTGRPRLLSEPAPEALAMAAGLAAGSAHPYARALVEAAAARGIAPASATGVAERPGAGIEGALGGAAARLGSPAWTGAPEGPGAAIWLRVGDEAPVRFDFADEIRPEAAALVAALKAEGLRPILLSGDAPEAVAAVAGALGIEEFAARLSPADKLARVAALKAAGRKPLMVGDGLNDAAALAGAHVSAAPATGLDAARTAADIVLLRGDLSALGDALRTARSARRRILQNFAIAGAYNLVAVPVALVGLATPFLAALAMSSSSITVSLNALRLR